MRVPDGDLGHVAELGRIGVLELLEVLGALGGAQGSRARIFRRGVVQRLLRDELQMRGARGPPVAYHERAPSRGGGGGAAR